MAALKSLSWVPCAFPPSNPPASNSNTLRPSQNNLSVLSLPSSQKIQRHAARSQAGAHRNAAARAEDQKHALVDNDESDDDLPPVEELLRIPPRPIASDKASSARPTFQQLDQQALQGVGMQAEQIQSGIYKRQGDSLDQPMILDDDESEEEGTEDEAEDGAGDIKTGRTEWDTSQHRTLGTSKSASGRTKAIDTSGPWYDVEEARYIDEPAVRLGPCKQRDIPCAPAQDQTRTHPPVFQSLQNHVNKQHVGNITLSTLVEPAPHSMTPLLNGNDGWTAESTAELEHGLEQALGEQVNSSSTSAPSSPHPYSVDAPQDNINTQEHTETTSSTPEEPQGASRHVTSLKEWEQQGTEEVNPSPRSASPSSPSSPAPNDKTKFGNLGEKRWRRGTYPEINSESQHSVNSDDTCDTGVDDQQPAKRRKPCAAPTLTTPLHARSSRFSVSPLTTSLEIGDTQPQADDGYPSNFVDNEQHYTSHTSRNSSTATEECFAREDEELEEPTMEGCSQKGKEENRSNNSKDENYSHDSGDEEEDLRLAKRRKTSLPFSDEVPTHRHPPTSMVNEQLHTPRLSRSPSATESSEPAAEYREWPFQGFLKKVRIGTKTTFSFEFALDDVPERLELSAPFEALGKILSIKSPPKVQTSQSTNLPSKHRGTSRPPKKRNPWTEEEDSTLKKMREEDNCSWEEISTALPLHPQGSIEVRYSKNFSNRTGSRKRQHL